LKFQNLANADMEIFIKEEIFLPSYTWLGRKED